MSETVHKYWDTGRCASLGKEVRLDLAPRPPNGFLSALNADDFENVVSVIEKRGGHVERADTICYATKENQDASLSLYLANLTPAQRA